LSFGHVLWRVINTELFQVVDYVEGAALLVRPGYDASARLDLLPPIGGYVVARTVVEGIKK
jgi:hypothetical protein